MEDDDDYFDSYDMDTSLDVDGSVFGEKNSKFDCLSTDDIVNLMNQFIADVDSVGLQVRKLFHSNIQRSIPTNLFPI